MQDFHIDFEFILVVFALLTGIIWLLDKLVLAGHRAVSGKNESFIVEQSKSFFPVLLVVLLLRSFLVEPFRIPSGSMLPTLEIGDFILVNKFAYGVHLPVLHTEVIPLGNPEPGDVVVFRYPEDPSLDFIKRVVGVPGDVVVYRNKQLTVNGVLLEQTALGQYDQRSPAIGTSYTRFNEVGPDSSHDILKLNPIPSRDFQVVVPERSYFVLGDNRDESSDSRVWGFVPEDNLVGKAFAVWMHWGQDGLQFHRIGNVIR